MVKKDDRYEIIFEGTFKELIALENLHFYANPFSDSFGDIENIQVGDSLDDIIEFKKLHRKALDHYILFSLTVEAMQQQLKKYEKEPLRKI